MTMKATEEVISKLQEVGPSVASTFLISPENYFEVITGLVDNFCHQNDLGCIYVTASVPARTLRTAFDSLEIDRKHVKFVDCISYATMQGVEDADSTVFVESPSLLENIILSIEYLFKTSDGKRKIVIIDSVNALTLHNDTRMFTEFVQILMSALKVREAYPVMIGLSEQLRPEVLEALALVSDQVVRIENRSTS
jgi:KaiC/GvpD/RAD55 family RecA-like ATPase